MLPTRSEYAAWIRTPESVNATEHALLLTPTPNRKPTHGHVVLLRSLSTLVGVRGPDIDGGLAAASELCAKGTPFAYMTLTNDHLPDSEKGHDDTLVWERTNCTSGGGAAVFIGPPGRSVMEGPAKARFCELSEGLARETGDPRNRFTAPCATVAGGRAAYEALLSSPVDTGRAAEAGPPRFLSRVVQTNKVMANGAGMSAPATLAQMSAWGIRGSDAHSMSQFMHAHGLLLLQYVDPPLLARGVLLGVPVATRVEARVHGLVQWEPLRIWASHYGFVRGGSPWLNFSSTADVVFNATNGKMWKANQGHIAGCDWPLPATPPPGTDANQWAACRAKGHRKPPQECCFCSSVSDVVDVEHDEAGFATGGTLRRLSHAAASAGVSPRTLWRNVDDALLRSFAAEQRSFQREASEGDDAAHGGGGHNGDDAHGGRGHNGDAHGGGGGGHSRSHLARWSTVFSADFGFTADGGALLFETLMQPSWKRPGYQWSEAADREKLGIHASLLLAMAPMVVDGGADAHHAQLLKPLKLRPGGQRETETLDLLRTQGLASQLGFRRVWPAPPRAAERPSLNGVLDARDFAFARHLHERSLLLLGMDVDDSDDALGGGGPTSDAWGGTSADPAARGTPRWPVGNGRLFAPPNPKLGNGRGEKCVESPRIVEEWRQQAEARREAAERKR